MSFKIMQLDNRPTRLQSGVQLDLSRDTAILFRQSRRGSDKLHIESRMLQESLIPFVKLARGEDNLNHIRIFDEGSGVSGTKGPDKRKKLRSMLEDIVSDLIGDIVLARADRLFRDKHFSNVSAFTELAEQKGIKVIVPTDKGIVVYDLTKTKDLQTFQQDMQAAYAYIENQIGYMNRARNYKMARGFYGGGWIPLPYVLLRDMPKEEQVQVIYEPWREIALDLFQKFIVFNFESGRLARYVEDKPYLFPFMPTEHLEEYRPVIAMTKVNGGYTFASIETLLGYLSNITLAGFAYGGRDQETGERILIPNAFEAAVPLDILEPCFAAITGAYIDGTPFLKSGKARQFRRSNIETDAILHGLLTSEQGSVNTYAQTDEERPCYACRKGRNFGQKSRVGIRRTRKVWELLVAPIDQIVLDRLIALAEFDPSLVERVKAYFGSVTQEGKSALEVLDTHIRKTEIALKKLSRTIVFLTKSDTDDEEETKLDPNDPIVKEHRLLQQQLRNLKRQRDEAAIKANEDPTASISDFYHVLSHLRSEFSKKDAQTKKDIMKKLIEEVKITVISPHLFTLHITWIQPLTTGRDDVALMWRSKPTRSETTAHWTKEEEETLRTLYPVAPQSELLRTFPTKTRGQMRNRANQLGVTRCRWDVQDDDGERFPKTVAYADLQAAAAFTQTIEERELLWREINAMAARTKRGEVSALWFLPIDMVSFSQSLCVTEALETGLSAPPSKPRNLDMYRSIQSSAA